MLAWESVLRQPQLSVELCSQTQATVCGTLAPSRRSERSGGGRNGRYSGRGRGGRRCGESVMGEAWIYFLHMLSNKHA